MPARRSVGLKLAPSVRTTKLYIPLLTPENILSFDPSNLRIGLGHDTHRLGAGGPLRIGGVEIEHDRHLIGHSDADVLLHAIIDGLLGAASLGDIGTLFPNSDEANKGRSSVEMLTLAYQQVIEAGFRIISIDCVIFAEQPKLAPYRSSMKETIASTLQIDRCLIGLKSKTGEKVDAVGEGRAISAQCVALLIKEPIKSVLASPEGPH